MSTIRKSILGVNTLLDSTGDAFFEPYSILATNDIFKHAILRLGASNAAAPTVKSGVYGATTIPKDFNSSGTTKVYIYWTSTLTSGNVVFDFDYRSVGNDDSESLDQATFQESLTVTDAAPTSANNLLITSVTLTSSNLAADDIMEFFVGRDGADGSDTLAGSAIVHAVVLEYTT